MLTRALLALLTVYRLTLSPVLALFGARCRFEPSCSRYASACIESHGPLRGGLLSLLRVCKCSPFHPGGFDPPPPRRTSLPTPSVPPPPLVEASAVEPFVARPVEQQPPPQRRSA